MSRGKGTCSANPVTYVHSIPRTHIKMKGENPTELSSDLPTGAVVPVGPTHTHTVLPCYLTQTVQKEKPEKPNCALLLNHSKGFLLAIQVKLSPFPEVAVKPTPPLCSVVRLTPSALLLSLWRHNLPSSFSHPASTA